MGLKLGTAESTPQLEPPVRPKERVAPTLRQIGHDPTKAKERDHGCLDDQVEVSSTFFLLKVPI